MKDPDREKQLIEAALGGDRQALEDLLVGVQDMVFNLSLRMLGTVPDAEDAAQEILVKVMTRLASFRGESSFATWVFRVAANHLKTCRKGMFAAHPLSFEAYGEDIVSGRERDLPDLSGGVDRSLLEQELKLSCTNVMLQCLDPESRCAYILGTMFRLDSRVAAQALELTPEAYRQRLSRARKKMAAFLGEYCGLGGGVCACARRVDYAVSTHRIDPAAPAFAGLSSCGYDEVLRHARAMEQLDQLSQVFAGLPAYRTPAQAAGRVRALMRSESFAAAVQDGGTGA